VGDSEGLLWRVDLHSKNPEDWKMDLFFDAYSGKAWNEGQPIATPPVLSVDTIGNVSVLFSTGDQESFLENPAVTNYLWSLLEDSAGTPAFKSKANWNRVFPKAGSTSERGGERVSGPMQIFNSNVYYTTYNPPSLGTSQQLCTDGTSSLCAMHYLRAAESADTGGEPARPALPNSDSSGCSPQGDDIIFGPGITQEPTCFTSDTYNDPYLGTQQHTSLANVAAGKFNLVVQTGMHGQNETKGLINTTTIGLQNPLAGTRIDSWAAVVE
jgi:hypothetical protein